MKYLFKEYNVIAVIFFFVLAGCSNNKSTPVNIDQYNIVWDSPSENSLGSMPVGGGDIGCNVWVENGEILFYMSRSGTFDENNSMLKLGRTRIKLSPNPFGENSTFRQELNLRDGCVYLTGKNNELSATIKLWVEVHRPEIHVDIESSIPVDVESIYETWRTKDTPLSKNERMQCLSFLDTEPEIIPLTTYKDSVRHTNDEVIWFHRNRNDDLVIDKEIIQQRLDSIKNQLWNPLKNLTFGGCLTGDNMSFANTFEEKYMLYGFTGYKLKSNRPDTRHEIDILLHVSQTETIGEFEDQLENLKKNTPSKDDRWEKNLAWWKQFWDRSYIIINPGKGEEDEGWKIGRNYQLFRYMLGCNAYGKYPSKFNGSLFTVDNREEGFTPDFRMWGGGSFTAQNQRLVYWPMLRSGDFDMMHSQFNYYMQAKSNAELRTKHYWGHNGAGFTEQIANYGLPVADIYHYTWGNGGLGPRPDSISIRKLKNENGEVVLVKDHGYLANRWCEDLYDTALEFCLMILEVESYSGQDISEYIPLIESCISFYNEHYRYWNKKLNGQELDENGYLRIYPGSSAETYKVALNPTTTCAGLKTVLTHLLELPEKYASGEKRAKWREILKTIPPVSLMEKDGHTIIAPAKEWERVSNIEFPAMYAVYPYNLYGLGNEGLQIGVDTWLYGEDEEIMKSSPPHIQKSDFCWFQSGIFCARLGLVDEAKDYLKRKMLAKSVRFPAFWDNQEGYDSFCQIPDVDHGGAGMINLQEMLLQTNGKELRVLPSWPKEWDVVFKLYAPFNTTVEGKYTKGKNVLYNINRKERQKDVIISKDFVVDK